MLHSYDIKLQQQSLSTIAARNATSLIIPVLTQNRSLKASVEPNAQQLPQDDWSLTWPIISAHCGQANLPSKDSGISPVAVRKFSFSTSGAMNFSEPGRIVPSNFFKSSVVAV